MKFEYETPEIEFISLDLRDIIATSDRDETTTDPNEGPIVTRPTSSTKDENEGEIVTRDDNGGDDLLEDPGDNDGGAETLNDHAHDYNYGDDDFPIY